MSVAPISELAWRSANMRRERVRMRIAVGRGVSLAVLIAENRIELRDVEVRKLVRWLPGVGESHARSILRGVPDYARLRNLTPGARSALVERVRRREQHVLTHAMLKEHPYA